MSASTSDSSAHDSTGGAAVAALADSVTDAVPLVEPELTRWREFLREQERLCVEHGFRAAMVTIGLDSPDDLQRTVEQLPGVLRSTDRAGVLCDTELAVLLIPLQSIHHAQRLVHLLDGALRAAKLTSHIGWAMRLDGHGLFHAAARADAAMVSARSHCRRSTGDTAES